MPNYVEMDLFVHGEPEDLIEFKSSQELKEMNGIIKEGADEDEPYLLSITMKAAWQPPIKYLKVFAKFPKLQFSLYTYESGMAFQCGYEFEDGKMVSCWKHNYYGTRGG